MSDFHAAVQHLPEWRLSGMCTSTRTYGRVVMHKNGGALDIWMRVNGRPRWVGVSLPLVQAFLNSEDETLVLSAESNGNAE